MRRAMVHDELKQAVAGEFCIGRGLGAMTVTSGSRVGPDGLEAGPGGGAGDGLVGAPAGAVLPTLASMAPTGAARIATVVAPARENDNPVSRSKRFRAS